MKYINDPSLSKREEVFYSRFGKTGDEITSHKEKVYAQILHGETDDQYYVRQFQGSPYDPFGTNSNRERFIETKMRKVSQAIFDFYMVYLKTKNSIYLTKASRGMLNG